MARDGLTDDTALAPGLHFHIAFGTSPSTLLPIPGNFRVELLSRWLQKLREKLRASLGCRSYILFH